MGSIKVRTRDGAKPSTIREGESGTSMGDGSIRLAYRLDEVAAAFGVSRRTIERERSAGRFPKPDLKIGRVPLWRPATLENWMARSGRPG
jgi:predicted DNA-binding transcriptional regulator AlpA